MRNPPYPSSQIYNITAHTCNDFYSKSCNCSFLSAAESIKYLGIIIDHNFSFKIHINHIANRVRKLIYIFKQLRHSADTRVMKMIYTSLCQSILSYCITCWGGATKTNLLTAERAQRALLKVSFFKPKYYSTNALYKECKVLNVRQLFILHIILNIHSVVPEVDSIQSTQTVSRRKHKIFGVIGCRTSFARRFSLFLSPRLYNIANKHFAISPMGKRSCRQTLLRWLLSLSYEETENLLTVIS